MAFSTMGTAGGALGGAAAGAQLGSIVPGIGTAIGAIGGGLLGGLAGSGALSGGSSTAKGLPSFSPQQDLAFQQQEYNQMYPQALGYGQNAFNQAESQGLGFAKAGTQQNIAEQNKVTPGSSQQRELALQQLNSYIQGQIPLDVQQQINRQVAQNLGGGFNLFSGGGQAPQNFARNIGQTSVGLSQYGLSAAPTWQQLANTMVVSPAVGLEAGLQASGQGASLAAQAAGLGNQLAESQYQAGFNQYQAQQLANQQQAQLGMGLGQLGLESYSALNKGNYLNSLASPSSQIPAAQYSGSMVPLSSAPQSVQQQYGWGQYANQ